MPKVPRRMTFLASFCFVALFLGEGAACARETGDGATRPNVVLVMIDDMGYGDLSCHGGPFLRTQHLDRLHASSVRLTDFHVAPMCTPTRAQLMTGLDAMRTGAMIVGGPRMMPRPELPFLPGMLASAGYRTAHFGKWHLGENYPHRPQDRGFQETHWFPLQEISSVSDYWQNDYFDPTLRTADGGVRKFTGYCTDVYFDAAMRWIERGQASQKPFFCYLALNVCHGPQWAPAELRDEIGKQFPHLSAGQIGYLAMLANADTNMGRLDAFLEERGLRENTIVIFLSDNGGYALVGEYNAGMRGSKSRLYEGGHRAPCFVRWPAGKIGGEAGRDLSGLTQVQDIAPTLLEACGVNVNHETPFDGSSLLAPLRGEAPVPERTLIVQYGLPEPFRMTCVLRGSWRLLSDIRGRSEGTPELYDLSTDPLQERDLIAERPDVARELRSAYDAWWQAVAPHALSQNVGMAGHPAQPRVMLSPAEGRLGRLAYMQDVYDGVDRKLIWDFDAHVAGNYRFELRRWPHESGLALTAAAPAWSPRDTSTPDHLGLTPGAALPISRAGIRVDEVVDGARVKISESVATFTLSLEKGRHEIEAWFETAGGDRVCPAYFVTIERIP